MRLELRDVGKRFGNSQALRGVTLSIPDFQSLAIIGPSGGGKTTLLRILAGLTAPDAGSVSIDGQALEFSETALLAHRRGIGTVFQAYNLFPHLSARENVLLPLIRVHGLPPHGWSQAHCIPVEPIVGRADILLAVSLASDRPNDLSWGLFRGFRIALRNTDSLALAAE